MQFTIKKLPKAKITHLEYLPHTPGLYFAVDTALRVWYIGKCHNLNTTLQSHEMYSTFVGKQVFWIAYFSWEDWDDLTDWESENISIYNPPLNNDEDCLPLTNLGYSKSQYLARYKDIQEMIKMLEDEKESLKPNIVSILEDNDGKITTDNYNAWMTVRKSYKYSSRVEKLQQELVKLQRDEESLGIAEIKSIVVFPVVRVKR